MQIKPRTEAEFLRRIEKAKEEYHASIDRCAKIMGSAKAEWDLAEAELMDFRRPGMFHDPIIGPGK